MVGDADRSARRCQRSAAARPAVDAYLAAVLLHLALIAAALRDPGGAAAARRGDHRRAEPVLATAVSRARWALSHLLIALAGTAAVLPPPAPAGLATRSAGDAGQLPRCSAPRSPRCPPPGCSPALAALLFGVLPQASAAAWGVLAACLIVGELGRCSSLPAGRRSTSRPSPTRRACRAATSRRRRSGWRRSPPRSPAGRDSPASGGATWPEVQPCQRCVKVALACVGHARLPRRHP